MTDYPNELTRWMDWLNHLTLKVDEHGPDGGDYDDGYITAGSPHHKFTLSSRSWHKFGQPSQRAMLAAWIERMCVKGVTVDDAAWIMERAKEIFKDDEAYDDFGF